MLVFVERRSFKDATHNFFGFLCRFLEVFHSVALHQVWKSYKHSKDLNTAVFSHILRKYVCLPIRLKNVIALNLEI
jgi:hypothetical protein